MTAPAEDRGLREQIREQATRLFATRGFAGTSIREVCEACSCTKPALYYYYPSKEALFREVVESHQQAIDAMIRGTVDGVGTVRERLHAGLDGMIDYCIEQPLAIRLIQRLETSPEDTAPQLDMRAAKATHLDMLASLMRTGIASGELKSGLDPLDGALLFGGAMHFQFELSIVTEEWDRERIHRTINLVLDGIAS